MLSILAVGVDSGSLDEGIGLVGAWPPIRHSRQVVDGDVGHVAMGRGTKVGRHRHVDQEQGRGAIGKRIGQVPIVDKSLLRRSRRDHGRVLLDDRPGVLEGEHLDLGVIGHFLRRASHDSDRGRCREEEETIDHGVGHDPRSEDTNPLRRAYRLGRDRGH